MELQRFNPFKRAHKALRGLICKTLIQLQQADLNHELKLQHCVDDIKVVIELLEEHAALEDDYILPVLPPEAASSVLVFEQQHAAGEMLCLNLQQLMEDLEHAETTARRAQQVPALLPAYIEFAAFNLRHMNMEEQLLNPLLWLIYTDAELEQIVMEAVKQSRPKHHALFWGLMIEHQNDEELHTWFCDIDATAPPAVFQQFEALASQVLPVSRFNVLKPLINKHRGKGQP